MRVNYFDIQPSEVEALDDQELMRVRQEADAFARLNYCNVYVLDLFREQFVYVRNELKWMRELLPEAGAESGGDYFERCFLPSDAWKMQAAARAAARWVMRFPADERSEFILMAPIRISRLSSHGHEVTYHKVTPLRMTASGKVWLALCADFIAARHTSEVVLRKGARFWIYRKTTDSWHEETIPTLREREREMLVLSAAGMDIDGIARALCTTQANVKRIRHNVYRKLHVDNITEAINFSLTHQL